MIFSKRYKELIFKKDGVEDDIFCNVSFECKKRLCEVLLEFNEPKKVKIGRYSKGKYESRVINIAIDKFNKEKECQYLDINLCDINFDFVSYFANQFAYDLFDLIEIHYLELSTKEKNDFAKCINEVFYKYEYPRCLSDGKIVKIDSKLFEIDLKNKNLKLLNELKNDYEDLKPAYDELIEAFELFNKEYYSQAVSDATKSYESVLKVYLGLHKGNANELTINFSEHIKLPNGINNEGFANNVLMSLPYIRNKATGHGAGSESIIITKELANLSLNLACSLISFVVEEIKKKNFE